MNNITLVSIGNINHTLTEFSVNKSIENMPPSDTFIVSDKILSGVKYQHNFVDLAEINHFTVDGQPAEWNFDTYNVFLLKALVHYIKTDYIINIHYDGFPVNRNYWTDQFLEYDYIGSPTHRDWIPLTPTLKSHSLYDVAPDRWYNGGGGFTLRSKKLLSALTDSRIVTELSGKNFERSEDVTISIKYRKLLEEEYGIKFAPLDVSLSFCTELITGLPYSFGFHGWSNIPLFLGEGECMWYVDNLNRRDIFRGSPMVKRYVAMCIISDYRTAIKHIDSVVGNAEVIARKNGNYSR